MTYDIAVYNNLYRQWERKGYEFTKLEPAQSILAREQRINPMAHFRVAEVIEGKIKRIVP